jgi:predicted ATP-binding protein involved in virulence
MYIESINIENFRTFRNVKVKFTYKDRKPDKALPSPKLENINLLLGNNGLGKTTLLKAISLAALGPAVADSGIYPYRLVRREPDDALRTETKGVADQNQSYREALLEAEFKANPQDEVSYQRIESRITISQRGDLEQLRWAHGDEKLWHPIFSSSSAAFFFVGYGASRRVEKRDQADIASRRQSSFARAQRIQSIFEEAYSLLPLSAWLPGYKQDNLDRYDQVVDLINKLMGKGHYKFTGELEDNEFIFERGGLKIPFPALSDGYRAYLGWICDLIYHICMTCPPESQLVDNHGIVMVDEIDLHIHPKWQINMLPVLAEALPNIQFIVTSHSPLVAGSLEWMNIIVMEPSTRQSSKPKRIKESIHGLDADQILLTDFFGMQTTRAPAKESQLQKLTESAREGDVSAAKDLLKELTKGME